MLRRLVLVLLLAAPARAYCELPPECAEGRHHKIDCSDVLDCVVLPPPPPCLAVDITYYACDRKLREVDATYPKPAYLCAIEGPEERRSRRHKRVAAIDAVVEAQALNNTVCH